MAAGIPKGPVHCKRCDTEYPNFSELRKHQWAAHKGLYKNMTKKRAKNRQIKQNSGEIMVSVRSVLNGSNPGINAKREMTARELLMRIIEQRDFMTDVVGLVQGLIDGEVSS